MLFEPGVGNFLGQIISPSGLSQAPDSASDNACVKECLWLCSDETVFTESSGRLAGLMLFDPV